MIDQFKMLGKAVVLWVVFCAAVIGGAMIAKGEPPAIVPGETYYSEIAGTIYRIAPPGYKCPVQNTLPGWPDDECQCDLCTREVFHAWEIAALERNLKRAREKAARERSATPGYELAPATAHAFTTRVTLGAADAAPVALASHGRPVARAARLVARPVHRAKGLFRKLPVLRRLGSCGLRGCR